MLANRGSVVLRTRISAAVGDAETFPVAQTVEAASTARRQHGRTMIPTFDPLATAPAIRTFRASYARRLLDASTVWQKNGVPSTNEGYQAGVGVRSTVRCE